nr:DUF2284 domain-containing protein [Hydrogeniiclostridium mannosilyticum]
MQQADLMEKFEALGKSLECRTNCAEIDVSRIVFDAGLRKSCEMNSCGAYGRNYMCPPFCGEIHELIDKAKSYQKAFVFQSIHALEDSFDIENMEKGSLVHSRIVCDMGQYARAADAQCLVLGAGGCRNCTPCAAQKGEPCRFRKSVSIAGGLRRVCLKAGTGLWDALYQRGQHRHLLWRGSV